MNYRKSTFVTLSLLMVFGWVYAISIGITTSGGVYNSSIGPSYFPNILAVLLTVLCLINMVQTARKTEDETVELPYFKYILITLTAIVLFLLSWYFIGYFYINAFLFMMALFFIYRRDFSKKQIAFNVVLSLLVIVIVYLVFEVTMSIPL